MVLNLNLEFTTISDLETNESYIYHWNNDNGNDNVFKIEGNTLYEVTYDDMSNEILKEISLVEFVELIKNKKQIKT